LRPASHPGGCGARPVVRRAEGDRGIAPAFLWCGRRLERRVRLCADFSAWRRSPMDHPAAPCDCLMVRRKPSTLRRHCSCSGRRTFHRGHRHALACRRRRPRCAVDRRYRHGGDGPPFPELMYSYPNLIPLNAGAIRTIAQAIEPLAFDRIYGGWWGRNIEAGARAAFDASVRRYLAAISDGVSPGGS
jgi:hypothetical protein